MHEVIGVDEQQPKPVNRNLLLAQPVVAGALLTAGDSRGGRFLVPKLERVRPISKMLALPVFKDEPMLREACVHRERSSRIAPKPVEPMPYARLLVEELANQTDHVGFI
ncbi:MAG: hypothetical protein ACRDKA_03355 [Actinomycetota bacterium]